MSHYDDDDNPTIREVLSQLSKLNERAFLQSTYLPDAYRYQELSREIGKLHEWFRIRKIPVTTVFPRVFIGNSFTAMNDLPPKRPTPQEIAEKLQQLNEVWNNSEVSIEKKIEVLVWWRTKAISILLEYTDERWKISTWLEPKIEVRHYANGLLSRQALQLGLARQLLNQTQSGDWDDQVTQWMKKMNQLEVEASLNGVLP